MVKVIGVVVVVLVLLAIPFLMYVSYSNGEVRLRNQIAAQQKSNEVTFDTVWKIISQQAQVAEQHKDAFRSIYVDIMDRRYAGKDPLLSFITEHNPTFDMKLYEKVSNSIEEQRTVFKRDQQKLIDLKREHDNALTTAPSSWFVGSRSPIDIKIVTSTKTEKTFETGKDDDTKVFPEKK